MAGRELPVADPGTALRQIALAVTDLALASAALYVLLPASANVSYVAFVGLYMVALAVSLLSLVPGGLGVFESILVLLLPGVPAPQLLGALLAYRLVYYVLPFGVAVLMMSAHEFQRQRARLSGAGHGPSVRSTSSCHRRWRCSCSAQDSCCCFRARPRARVEAGDA